MCNTSINSMFHTHTVNFSVFRSNIVSNFKFLPQLNDSPRIDMKLTSFLHGYISYMK